MSMSFFFLQLGGKKINEGIVFLILGSFPIRTPFSLCMGLRVGCKKNIAMHGNYQFYGCESMWISLKLGSCPSRIDMITYKIIEYW